MSELDAPLAESSPAADDASPAPLSSLSSADLKTWRQTGERPTALSSSAADSTPAAPAEQAASTDATPSPASEPGKPSKNPKTEARFQELLDGRAAEKRRADALEAELASYRSRPAPATPDAPAASSPAPQDLAATISQPDVTRPRLSETEFFDRFPEATVADLTEYVSNYVIEARDRQAQARHVRESKVGGYRQQIDAAVTANASFFDAIDPKVASLMPVDLLPVGQTPTPYNVIAQEVLESSQAPGLLTALSQPGELDRIARLHDPRLIAKAIGRLEARLEMPSAPPVVVAKAASSAPPPPVTLGSKPGTQADEVDEALKSRDFARYKAAMNRRERAGASA